ncbi:unnamed protein product [Durusdinium trenchii]|uniref:6-phosphofructo-2-kinase domain-containing protein n=1 Tax=Durusdinium trenchii TaxID=1381693 RepID=A0ABP0ITA5_9DINO
MSAGGDAYYNGSAEVGSKILSDRQLLREQLTPNARGLIVAMVGLPARGKSFISRKVERFLKWGGNRTQTFNVGKYRRDAVDPERSGKSDFFDNSNSDSVAQRMQMAMAALADAIKFLDEGGKFAIFDATNSTVARRQMITEKVTAGGQYSILWVEAVCDEREVVLFNMLTKVRYSPDFQHMTEEQAMQDLKQRIANYEKIYETVQDSEGAFIKLFNLSSKVMANHCYGRVAKSILPFLMAIHIGSRPIWLTRAGAGSPESKGQHGSDRASSLSQEGQDFAKRLAKFVKTRAQRYWERSGKPQEETQVFTSTMPRAVSSARCTAALIDQRSALNPIDKGVLGAGWWDVECAEDVPPWKEMDKRHPEFMKQFQQDPLYCQFPGGERYMDVVMRLESVLIDVEMCTSPVLIVSHITTLQVLLAYFKGIPVEEAWKLSLPKNMVVEVSPTEGGGFLSEEHDLCLSIDVGGNEPVQNQSLGFSNGGKLLSVRLWQLALLDSI